MPTNSISEDISVLGGHDEASTDRRDEDQPSGEATRFWASFNDD
jgi:hypothetical protein